MERNGAVWAGSFSGSILEVNPKSGKTKQTAKLPEFIDYAVADSAGRVFFGTTSGIYVRDSNTPHSAPAPIPAVNALMGGPAWVFAGCESPGGDVWFLAGNRLLHEKDNQWTKPQIDGL